eukprot:05359.XXX_207832_207975_1 [CDS] Oithona nana genome sequencing.
MHLIRGLVHQVYHFSFDGIGPSFLKLNPWLQVEVGLPDWSNHYPNLC